MSTASGEQEERSSCGAESPGEIENVERSSAGVFSRESHGHVASRNHESEPDAIAEDRQRREPPGSEACGGDADGDELESGDDAEAWTLKRHRCGERSAGKLRGDEASEFGFGDAV